MKKRTGRFNVARGNTKRAAAQLCLDDFGLLHRIWADLRWTPKAVIIRGQMVHLGPGQALVSQAEYAREFRCGRGRIRKSLTRLCDAGWFTASNIPAGTLITCLRDPREDPDDAPNPEVERNNTDASPVPNDPPAEAPPPGLESYPPLVWNRTPPWSGIVPPPGLESYSNCYTPQTNTSCKTPPGPQVASYTCVIDKCEEKTTLHPAFGPVCSRAEVRTCTARGLVFAARSRVDAPLVLGWLLTICRRASKPRDPDAWLVARCRPLSTPPDDDYRAAKDMLGMTRRLPLNWLAPRVQPDAVRLGDCLPSTDAAEKAG